MNERIIKYIGIFLFLNININLFAQDILVHNVKQYSFLNDSAKNIQYPDSIEFDRRDLFFSKLDSVVLCHKGKVNILHLGGSHVQADFFSHTVRCHLDSLNGDLKPSRGIIFPFKTAKTNNPTNYKVYSKGAWVTSKNVKKDRIAKLGVTGIAVTTEDRNAEIKVNMNPKDSTQRWGFTMLRLLGYTDSLDKVTPIIMQTDSTWIMPEHDSETESYIFRFSGIQDSFLVKFVQNDSVTHKFSVCGFLLENEDDGIIYHSIGVNGAAVPSFISCENFERDLQWIHPDLVIFAIGINDAVPVKFSETQFIANYDSLISEIEQVNPECFYIFITNNDSFRKIRRKRKTIYVVNSNAIKVEHAFQTLARKHNGGYWNLFQWMGGLESMRKWEQNGLAQKDKIHFTKKGYQLIGDVFYNALVSSYLEKE